MHRRIIADDATRALDYAAFFERHRPELAALKRRQAVLFGRGHTLAVRGQWAAVAAVVEEIATIEQTLGAAFAGAAARAADSAVRVAARRGPVTPAGSPA